MSLNWRWWWRRRRRQRCKKNKEVVTWWWTDEYPSLIEYNLYGGFSSHRPLSGQRCEFLMRNRHSIIHHLCMSYSTASSKYLYLNEFYLVFLSPIYVHCNQKHTPVSFSFVFKKSETKKLDSGRPCRTHRNWRRRNRMQVGETERENH